MDKDEKRVERLSEDAPFEVPPFDEKQFIRKELLGFRTNIILFVIAIIAAAATYFMWKSDVSFLFQLLVALIIGAALIPLSYRQFGVDISTYRRKEWLGTASIFFLFWMGLALLLSNPPITDHAPPHVEVGVSPTVQELGRPVFVAAFVADNVEVSSARMTICGPQGCQDTDAGGQPFWNTTYIPTVAGAYNVTVTGRDQDGRERTVSTRFTVGRPISNVSIPASFSKVTDSVDVRISPELRDHVWSVEFSLDGGTTWHRFARHDNADLAREGWWISRLANKGWTPGTHNLTVRALVQSLWLGNNSEFRVPGGEVYAGGGRTITVPAFDGVGAIDAAAASEQPFRPQGQTPGPGLLLVVAAVLVAAILGRRRRHA